MKKTSKALLLALCAVLLVAGSVLGTVAYLTSEDTVTNTFTVGNVKITLDEAKVGTDGKAVDPEERVDTNTYHLLPGGVYDKDPTVHVATGSEDCFVFVEVENGLSEVEATGNTTIANQMTEKGWEAVSGVANVYVYTNKTGSPVAATAGQKLVLFENITISSTIDQTVLKADNVDDVVITAYAIQAAGFDTQTQDAADIWEALDGQLNPSQA